METDNNNISAADVCEKCGAACCKIGGADFTLIEMQRVLSAGFSDFFVKLNDDHYELTCKKGICPYLTETNRCSIYELRPLVCRSFPVYISLSKDEEKYSIIGCPLAKYLSKEEIEDKKKMVDEVENILRFTFTGTKLPEEDYDLIQKRFDRINDSEQIKIF